MLSGMASTALLRAAVEHTPPAPHLRVVDAGGDGALPEAYLACGARVTALAASVDACGELRRASRRFHHVVSFEAGTPLAGVGIRPGTVDLFLWRRTEVSGGPADALRVFAEALSPGGTIVVAYPENLASPRAMQSALEVLGLGIDHDAPLEGVSGVLRTLVARRVGAREPLPVGTSHLDRTSCVDRRKVSAVAGAPLSSGPVVTRWVPADDPVLLSELDAMMIALRQQLTSADEVDPAAIPLPTRTADDAHRGFVGTRVLALFAHPDDEAVYAGGTIARLSAAGVRVRLVTATGGGGGRDVTGAADALSATRAAELSLARDILGLEDVQTLGFDDFGKYRDEHRSVPVSGAESLRTWGVDAVLEALVREIRKARPMMLLSFDPSRDPNHSLHGHHLGIGLASMLAFHLAADARAFPQHVAGGLRPWAVGSHQVVVPNAVGSGRLTRVPIDGAVKRAALRAHASQLYSTEWLIQALDRDDPDARIETWHLLQAREGASSGLEMFF